MTLKIIPIPLNLAQRVNEENPRLVNLLAEHGFLPMSYGFYAVPEDYPVQDNRNGQLRNMMIRHPSGEPFISIDVFYIRDTSPEQMDPAKCWTQILWKQ